MENPHSILKKVFGYDSFRPGQEDIVRRLLDGQDVLAVDVYKRQVRGCGCAEKCFPNGTKRKRKNSLLRTLPCLQASGGPYG